MAQLNVGGNFLAGLTGGLQAGQGIRQMQDQNALRAIGPDLMSEDPAVFKNALGQMAQVDPIGAQDIMRTRQADQRAEQQFSQTTQLNTARLEQIKAEGARAAAAEAARMTAEQKAAEAAKIDSALASASAAYQQGPEAFAAWTQANAAAIQESGLDPAQITHEAFPMIAAGLVGARDGLTAGAEFAEGLQPEAAKPLSPEGKLAHDQQEGFLDLDLPQEVDFETEQKLRKEFIGIPAVKAFSEQAQAFGRIVNSARDPSPAGDLALIFNFMKVLDPGSVVRESEFATAEQAAAWLQQSEEMGVTVPRPIAGAIRKMQTGQRLSTEQREDFVSRGKALYAGAEQGFNSLKSQYEDMATAYGIDPTRSLPDFRTSIDTTPSAPEQNQQPTFTFENDAQKSVFEKYSQP